MGRGDVSIFGSSPHLLSKIGAYHESIGYVREGENDGNPVYVKRIKSEVFDAKLKRFIRKSVVISTIELDATTGQQLRCIGGNAAYIVPRRRH